MKILHIEDDSTVQAAIALMMKVKGHDVICTDNGEDAVALATGENDIDMIISDGEFLGDTLCTGPETIKAIQAAGVVLPTLFFSANNDILNGARAQKEAGVIQGKIAFLLKPASKDKLYDAIETIIPGFTGEQGVTPMRPALTKTA